MFRRMEVIASILEPGVLAVVGSYDLTDDPSRLFQDLRQAGIRAIEIPLVAKEGEVLFQHAVSWARGRDVFVGAGTVFNEEGVSWAIREGADFVATPHVNPQVIRRASRQGVPCLPGAMSATEVREAMELGAELIRVYPLGVFGPQIIKDILAVCPRAGLIASGGLMPGRACEWVKSGAVAVSWTVCRVDDGDNWARDLASRLIEEVNSARQDFARLNQT